MRIFMQVMMLRLYLRPNDQSNEEGRQAQAKGDSIFKNFL